MGGVSGHLRQGVAVERPLEHGPGDFLERPHLRPREAEPGKPVGACPNEALRRERVVGGGQPSPDRAGARRRQLLGNDDGGKAGKPARPAAQRQGAGARRDGPQPRVDRDEHVKSGGDIGLGVDAGVQC